MRELLWESRSWTMRGSVEKGKQLPLSIAFHSSSPTDVRPVARNSQPPAVGLITSPARLQLNDSPIVSLCLTNTIKPKLGAG